MQGSQCAGFLGWVDPDMCKRSSDIRPGLLRSKNQLQSAVDELQAAKNELEVVNEVLVEKLKASDEEAKKKGTYLVLSWVFFVVVFLFK